MDFSFFVFFSATIFQKKLNIYKIQKIVHTFFESVVCSGNIVACSNLKPFLFFFCQSNSTLLTLPFYIFFLSSRVNKRCENSEVLFLFTTLPTKMFFFLFFFFSIGFLISIIDSQVFERETLIRQK